jgi:hypothetical protein
VTVTRLHISVFLGVAVIAWGVALAIAGVEFSPKHLASFGAVVTAMVVFALLLEYVFWHWRWLDGWFFQRPDLRGTWRVVLQSDWVDPDTGRGIPPITCYMAVTQTLSKLQMHLMTPESDSWFVVHAIRRSQNESGYEINGIYTNRPSVGLRPKRSGIHLGAVTIETHGVSHAMPGSLTGEYWTDRKTTGVMKFDRRVPTVYTRYDDAHKAFEGVA